MRWCRPWTTFDHDKYLQMKADGRRVEDIARALGRSIAAIKSHGTYARVGRLAEIPLPPRETIAITRAEVPEYYELMGWRFIGFNGDLCMFEWQSEREPRWPEQMREAA